MADRVVPIAKDMNKERLRELKGKIKAKQAGKPALTLQELEEAVEKILAVLNID